MGTQSPIPSLRGQTNQTGLLTLHKGRGFGNILLHGLLDILTPRAGFLKMQS